MPEVAAAINQSGWYYRRNGDTALMLSFQGALQAPFMPIIINTKSVGPSF